MCHCTFSEFENYCSLYTTISANAILMQCMARMSQELTYFSQNIISRTLLLTFLEVAPSSINVFNKALKQRKMLLHFPILTYVQCFNSSPSFLQLSKFQFWRAKKWFSWLFRPSKLFELWIWSISKNWNWN